MKNRFTQSRKVIVAGLAAIIALSSVTFAGLYPVNTQAGFGSGGGTGGSYSGGSYSSGGSTGGSYSSGGSSYNSGGYSGGSTGGSQNYNYGNHGGGSTGSNGSYDYGGYSSNTGGSGGSYDSGDYSGGSTGGDSSYDYGSYGGGSTGGDSSYDHGSYSGGDTGGSGSYDYGSYGGGSTGGSGSYDYGSYSGGDTGGSGSYDYGSYGGSTGGSGGSYEYGTYSSGEDEVITDYGSFEYGTYSSEPSQTTTRREKRVIRHETPSSGGGGSSASSNSSSNSSANANNRNTVNVNNDINNNVNVNVDSGQEEDEDDSQPHNQRPIADIHASPLSGEVPLTVDFDCDDSRDPDGNIERCEWSIDGDDLGSVRSGSVTLNNSGSFDLRLRVTDNDGATDTDRVTINVDEEETEAPRIRTFQVQGDEDGLHPDEKVYFDVKACDGDSDTLDSTIDFNDGEDFDFTLDECETRTVWHNFDEEGTYHLELTVEDEDGNTDRETLRVEIGEEESDRPNIEIFRATSSSDFEEDRQVQFVVRACDDDDRFLDARLDFDDGHDADFRLESCSVDRIPHTYRDTGDYRARLIVEDDDNNEDFATERLTIVHEDDNDNTGFRKCNRCYAVQDPPPPGYTGPVDTRIYEIVDGKKHWLPSAEIVEKYGYNFETIQDVSFDFVDSKERVKFLSPTDSEDIYYVTEDWKTRKFPSREAFFSYGNEMSDVLEVSTEEIDAYERVKYIHLNGSDVYLLTEDGQKRPLSASAMDRLQVTSADAAPVNRTEFEAYPTGAPVQ